MKRQIWRKTGRAVSENSFGGMKAAFTSYDRFLRRALRTRGGMP